MDNTETLLMRMVPQIAKILEKGNSVEIKVRKDDIIALEVKRKIAASEKK